jgi:predicted enzyme related to lactoylglutathione lyase
MTARLVALRFDTIDPERVAGFWSALLGWPVARLEHHGSWRVAPPDDTGFDLVFDRADAPKREKNQMHFDLTSTSQADQDDRVARALDLGGRHIDVGQLPSERHVVLADPEGDEFCVIEPGNRFLADCGLIGAVSSDGSQAEGYFWAAALGWPLVWDQDDETAIRSPSGGPKITWGGPPLDVRREPNRLRFELETGAGADGLAAETARLVALGASVVRGGSDASPATLTSPDGNPFTVTSRP